MHYDGGLYVMFGGFGRFARFEKLVSRLGQ